MKDNKIYTVLTDIESEEIDALIISETTSSDEIENLMLKAREKMENDYQWEDFIVTLPKDCYVITDLNIIYY